MADILRVAAADARSRVSEGSALLVCAYDNAAAFRSNHLEGAISLQEFRAKSLSLDRGREVIFYCA